ncbi:MAG TPA: hypothetical protein VJL34_06820, partial [Anaerolineales bacterium]|nr:hypothetical protein [Anaerolineales bacterium]
KQGQRVRFVYTRGEPGVHAWDLPQPPAAAAADLRRYLELLCRAALTVLEPLGVEEAQLRDWLDSNAAYGAPPGYLLSRVDNTPENNLPLPLF